MKVCGLYCLVQSDLHDLPDLHITYAEWSSNRMLANYFSACVYASHFILGVLAKFSGV